MKKTRGENRSREFISSLKFLRIKNECREIIFHEDTNKILQNSINLMLLHKIYSFL